MFNIMLTDITKEILKICCRIKIENYNTNPVVKSLMKILIQKNQINQMFTQHNLDVPRNKRCPCD